MAKKEKQNLKSFTIHETDMKVVRHIKKAIISYKHLENMINILLKQELEKINQSEIKNYAIFNLLLDAVIMKAVLSNNLGSDKTKDRILLVNNYFKDNELFQSSKSMIKDLNDKNISMIIRRLSKDWKNFFKNRTEYFKNPSKFKGLPQFPKAKKLSKVYQYSVPIESDKFSLKRKNVLGITMFKKMIYTRFVANEYVNSKTIKSMTVSLSHGNIYYNFNYVVPKKVDTIVKKDKQTTLNIKKAGLDIGIKNTFSLFIDDKESQSLIFSGASFIKYNCYFNKQLSDLNNKIAINTIEFKTITKADSSITKVPIRYNSTGKSLIKKRSQLFECRNRYFDSEMNKISTKLLTYLHENKVTDLVISKNLSFTKQDGSIKQLKKDKQKFYQIPFGRFLNLIENKSNAFGVKVVDKDEAYTSKTSCLTRDVNVNQANKKLGIAVTLADLNGNRGVKGKALGRGMYKDLTLNKIINSDLNGAANHIKVGFPETDLSVYRNQLWKVCNPKKLKSSNDFDNYISNSKAKQQRLGLTNCTTFEQDDQI